MKRLLMVDDVPTNLRLTTEVLKGLYEVSTARSGEQALAVIDKVKPDLILLDISMPHMDGYSVLEMLKKNKRYANIPVIILTGDTTRDAEVKALELGAVDFIRKPFEPMVLKARVERALTVADMQIDLEMSSRRDPLTGLWNRIHIEEYFDRLGADETGSILMLDLDNFKKLNDTYGHAIGDKALISFGNTIIQMTDDNDITGRMGGDEFIIIRPGVVDRDVLRTFCRELIANVELHITELIGDVFEEAVTVSIGISQYPEDGDNFMQLYNCSDKALYYVKQNGKRGYHFYQDDCQSLADIAHENVLIDMEQLKLLVNENNDEKGAYQVEYSGFTRIYRFVSRYVERTGQNVQVVIFTLIPKDDCSDNILSQAMTELEGEISGLLRRADVATRFTATQFGVILMDTNKDNGMVAVRRVLDRFDNSGLNKKIEMQYEIQDISRGTK